MITVNENLGLLTITGTTGVDNLTLSESGGILTINDPGQPLVASGGATQADPNTVTIAVAALTEPVVVSLLDGDDTANATGVTVPVIFTGGAGADTITGGLEKNVADYSTSALGVTVNLATPTFTGGDADGDVITNIERITGSEQVDEITGDSDNNKLIGLGGDDTILGGAGNDNIEGGSGADILNGEGGTNRLSYRSSAAGVTVNLTTSTVSGGDATGDVISNFQNISGSQQADTLTGDSSSNRINGHGGNDVINGEGDSDLLFGDTGNDTLNGGSGNDFLYGEEGNDTLNGGADTDRLRGGDGDDILNGGDGKDFLFGDLGADSYDGGAGIDTASFEGSSTKANINLAKAKITAGDDKGKSIVNVENLIGSQFNDNFTGDNSDNTFKGNAGNDNLGGKNGNDKLFGGDGNDRLFGGSGDDLIEGGNDNDFVSAGGGHDDVDGDAGSDELYGGGGNDLLKGGDDGDFLYGESGADKLIGGTGSDWLSGGKGADVLTGGADSDTFVLDELSHSQLSGRDKITDFEIGVDSLLGPQVVLASDIDQLGSAKKLTESEIQSLLTTTVFEMDTAATFTVGSRTFLAINDGVAGFSASTDSIIELNVVSGDLANLSIGAGILVD